MLFNGVQTVGSHLIAQKSNAACFSCFSYIGKQVTLDRGCIFNLDWAN